MKHKVLAATAVFICWGWALGGPATSVRYGTGIPNLAGWCELEWVSTCAFGIAEVADSGQLTLYPAPGPPGSGLHVPLDSVPGAGLLLLLDSERPVGHLLIILDGVNIATIPVPTAGNWWVTVEGLPPQGVLRVELGLHMEPLTISSIYHECRPEPPPAEPRWNCWNAFLSGVLVGAALVGASVLLMGIGE